jgi:hypothetical protein
MKYRIKTDVSFASRTDALSFLNYLELIKSNCATGTENDQLIIREARFHECKHDDLVPTSCKNYTVIDFTGEQIIHE